MSTVMRMHVALVADVTPPLMGFPDEQICIHKDGLGYYRCRLNGWKVIIYKIDGPKGHQYRVELFDEDTHFTWDHLYSAARPDQMYYVDDDPVALLAALYEITSGGNDADR